MPTATQSLGYGIDVNAACRTQIDADLFVRPRLFKKERDLNSF